jgi:ubiquinone/menaquinone biosynthesis C-methylase UbiE
VLICGNLCPQDWAEVRKVRKTDAKEYREERYWSKLAHSYERDGEYVVGKPILQAILTRLSEEQDLGDCVEFGCGTGYFTRAVAGQARHLIATDLSDQMLEVARTQLSDLSNVTIQKEDCAHTDFPAESFDSVLMVNLIHVMDDALPCLQESYRILRSGGSLIVVDFTGYRLALSKTAQLVWKSLKRWGLPRRHEKHDLSPEELVRLVERAGFKVKDVHLLEGGSNAIYMRSLKCAKLPFT